MCLGPAGRTDLRAPRAEQGPTESLAPWVLLERRENWVFQDYPATQEDKVQRVPAASRASQGPTERKEPGAWRANPVQGGKEVQRVHEGVGVLEVLQASQALRARRAMMVHLARLAKEDLKDPRAPSGSQDQRAPLDHLERMGCPATLVSEERRDSKERQVHPAQGVSLVLRVPQERPVPSVREATLDPQVHPESRVFPALLAKREPRETPVPKEPQVKTVPLVYEDSQEREVFPARRVQLV